MEKLTMKNVREVLRLKLDCNLSARKIAQTCGFARSTIGEYISRFKQSGLDWPLPSNLSDSQLAKALYASTVYVLRVMIQRNQDQKFSVIPARSILGKTG